MGIFDRQKWLGIPGDRLSVTVYKDDEEAFKIWNETIGLPTSRIVRMDEDENFWPASAPSEGPDGVCGPCSEIYYHLEDGSDVEIWNLVFTQFNRVGSPPDNLQPLPSKNIDTGMGLERTASVLQGVPTNFHIDSLFPIVEAASEVCGVKYKYDSDNGRRLRRITDHARASVFAIHENVYPDRNNAPYVIRRLIRRAVLDGYQMDIHEPFLIQIGRSRRGRVEGRLSGTFANHRASCRSDPVRRKRVFNTIGGGMKRIESLFEQMADESAVMVPGNDAADLQTTYGVPPELVQTLAAERNFTFDWSGYRDAMDRHAVDSGKGQVVLFQTGPLETLKEALRETKFVGYEKTSADVIVKGIITGDGRSKGDEGQLLSHHVDSAGDNPMRLVLDQSPFYGESGGQVGDVGLIENDDFKFKVTDTQKHASLIVHHGKLVSGAIREGDACQGKVDTKNRKALARAHSATHILHHALHNHVGRHAEQQGSKVEADRLRFDFKNPKAIPEGTLAKIESEVLEKVAAGEQIAWDTVSLADAKKAGAMMLFGEKYPDPCRMVSMGDFSRELCGGTHLTNTSDVQSFEVVVEESVSTGTRRIEALTGRRAKQHRERTEKLLQTVSKVISCKPAQAVAAVNQLTEEIRNLKKDLTSGKATTLKPDFDLGEVEHTDLVDTENYQSVRGGVRAITRRLNVAITDVPERIEQLLAERVNLIKEIKSATAGGKISAEDLMTEAEMVGDILVLVAETPGANPNVMRGWIDQIRKMTKAGSAIMFASSTNNKVLLVGGLSRDLVDKGLSAGTWVGKAANMVGGGGGGRPDMAQAGGKDPTKLPKALEQARSEMRKTLS